MFFIFRSSVDRLQARVDGVPGHFFGVDIVIGSSAILNFTDILVFAFSTTLFRAQVDAIFFGNAQFIQHWYYLQLLFWGMLMPAQIRCITK